jgi:hypothetical protein
MTNTTLPTRTIVSNSRGFNSVPTEKDSLQRTGGLQITLLSDDRFLVSGSGNLFQPPQTWNTEIGLTQSSLFERTNECLQAWQTNLVDYFVKETGYFTTNKTYPFQLEWDLKQQSHLLAQQGPLLAVAGDRLFFSIFEDNADPVLKDIADLLRTMTIEQEAVFTITSDSFFVPWNMIYTHPVANEELKSDGSNFRPEGFWGYRHIIEHNTIYQQLDMAIGSDSPLVASLNVDKRIDKKLGLTTIKDQMQLFDNLHTLQVIKKEQRFNKPELQAAFERPDFCDRLVYFYCHGKGSYEEKRPTQATGSLSLTDGQEITRSDISYWRKKNQVLDSHPLVFINACQGGQMSTLFYLSIANEFLKHEAVGLIGSQIDIPAPFAAEYAKRLITRFVNGPQDQKTRLGPLMRDLTREFFDDHKNPLGLAYSLYRGADCYVHRRTAHSDQ